MALVDDDDGGWDYAKHELLTVASRIILNLLATHGFTSTCDLSWKEYFKMQHNNFSMVFGHHPDCHIEKIQFSLLDLFLAHPEYSGITWANHEVVAGDLKDMHQQLFFHFHDLAIFVLATKNV